MNGFTLYIDAESLENILSQLDDIKQQLSEGYKEGYSRNVYYNLEEER